MNGNVAIPSSDFLDKIDKTIFRLKVRIVTLGYALKTTLEKANLRNDGGTAKHHIVPKSALDCRIAIGMMEHVGY